MGSLNVYVEPFKIVDGSNAATPQLVWSHSGERDEDWVYMQQEVVKGI